MRAALNYFRLCWRLWRDPRVSRLAKLIPVAALLYFISPIDVLPDWYIPGVGYLDDVGVMMLALRGLVRFSPRRVLLDHQYWLDHPRKPDWDVEAEATGIDMGEGTMEGEPECQAQTP